jgi:putative glutamine amidotransferase
MNVALGGTLWRDLATEIPSAAKHDCYPSYPRDQRIHSLTVTPDSRLAHLLQDTSAEVNSLHHQACRDLAPDMRQVAVAPDGIVEAAEIPDHPYAVGVQWHPEWIQDTPDQRGLFAGLVNACGNGRI